MIEAPIRSRGFYGLLPPLAIDSSKKTEKYYEDYIDNLEYIATHQYISNLKYIDQYRMVSGKQSIKEAQEFVPYLKNLSPNQVEGAIPYYIRHYDLYGRIINAAVETYMTTKDDYYIQAIDEFSTNEALRVRDLLMTRAIRQDFQTELTETLRAEGLETDLTLVSFESEEEQLAYEEFIAQRQQELTPSEIDTYIQDGFKLSCVKWADITLRNDFKRFYEDDLIRQNVTDYFVMGKAFRNIFVGFDKYESQVWRAREVFHSDEEDQQDVSKRQYVGRTSLQSLSTILSRFGHLIPTSLVNKVAKQERSLGTNSSLLPVDLTEGFKSGYPDILPSPDYLDRQVTRNLENRFNVPLTYITHQGECGPITTKGYSSLPFNGRIGQGLLPYMHEYLGYELMYDVYQVTEAYFRDWQKTGLICYQNEYGTMAFEFITDDILNDFIKEFGITQVKTKSLDEMQNNPEPNTITWFYTPYSRYGLKIKFDTSANENFYFTEKTKYQIPGNSDMFDICHPVSGIIGDGIGNRLENPQAMYNMAMNQIHELIEKEVGVFFLFDYAFLMSDNKEMGKSNEAMELAMSVAKSLGFLGIDSSNSSVQEAIGAGQFQPINMSLTENINSRLQLALFYQQQAYDVIGVKIGTNAPPDQYKTAEGVKIDREATYAQLEHYYAPISTFLARTYTLQLAVAQYCQSTDKDVTAMYVHNDGTKNFIRFSDTNFPLRKLAVYPYSNAKERKQRETVQQYLLNNNTVNQDLIASVKIITSNSVSEMISAAREARQNAEEQIQNAQNNQLQLIQTEAEAEQNNMYYQWTLNEITKQRDRETQLQKAGIDAMGRALYRNAGTENADVIADQVDQSLRETQVTNDANYKQEKLSIDRARQRSKVAYDERVLELREKELQER